MSPTLTFSGRQPHYIYGLRSVLPQSDWNRLIRHGATRRGTSPPIRPLMGGMGCGLQGPWGRAEAPRPRNNDARNTARAVYFIRETRSARLKWKLTDAGYSRGSAVADLKSMCPLLQCRKGRSHDSISTCLVRRP